MNNILKKNIDIGILYFIYLICITFSTVIFLDQYISKFIIADENNNIILKNITFGHGPLIHNFFYNNIFSQNIDGINFVLKKTFALPFIIYLLSKISLNIYFIVITKNLFLYSLYFFISLKFYNSLNINKFYFIVLIIIPIFIPYNFYVSLNFNFEDCLLSILIPSLYLILITNNFKYRLVISSLIIFIIYFVKSSTFLLVLILPFLMIFIEKDRLRFFPIFFAILAISIWGLFGYLKTGKFPIGKSGTSLNSKVLSSAMNTEFHKFYPKKSTDLIPVENILKEPNFIKNEWDYYEYYDKRNKKYLEENLFRYFKDIILKVKFILFNIKKDGVLDKSITETPILISHVISKIFFNFSLLLLVFNIYNLVFKLRAYKKLIIKNVRNHLYFILFLGLLLPPHLIAWATSKHLVGLTSISIIYIYSFYFKGNSYKN